MLGATGAGAGVAVAIGSCGDGEDNPEVTQTVSPEQMRSDASVLNALLDLERTAVLAYAAAARRLAGPARALAREFGEHEREHRRTLEDGIRDLGAHPVPPRPAAAYHDGFPPLRSHRDVLRFALDVETTQISAYGESVGSLATPELRVLLASILVTEAEHESVIRGELGLPQAPHALVTGNAPP